MRTLPGVDHDDAFRMIDDPCVSRQPAGPVPVGKNRKPPRQAVPLPFDLRGFDPDEPRLNGVDFHGGQEPVKCADFAMLDHDPLRLNRIMISSFCWSMIFSENRFPPVGSWPEGMLFRIMLYPRAGLPKSPTRHSALRLDALMIGHHRSDSAFWNAGKASGDCCASGVISIPSSSKRLRTIGSARTCTIVAFSLAMISFGVSFRHPMSIPERGKEAAKARLVRRRNIR